MSRFEQEARAAIAFNHPNISHNYEISERNRVHFIAMEHIYRGPQREKIHSKHTELRKLSNYLEQVAQGLAKAHSADIVHRDLKPENLMITRER